MEETKANKMSNEIRTNEEIVAEFEEKSSYLNWTGSLRGGEYYDTPAKMASWLRATLESKDREREAAVREAKQRTWKIVHGYYLDLINHAAADGHSLTETL